MLVWLYRTRQSYLANCPYRILVRIQGAPCRTSTRASASDLTDSGRGEPIPVFKHALHSFREVKISNPNDRPHYDHHGKTCRASLKVFILNDNSNKRRCQICEEYVSQNRNISIISGHSKFFRHRKLGAVQQKSRNCRQKKMDTGPARLPRFQVGSYQRT